MEKAEKAFSNRRILGILSIFVLFAVSIVAVEYLGKNVLDGVRGFMYGEGRWSKAQKEATVALLNYLNEEEEFYYYKFENSLSVIDADRRTREELTSENPDYDLIRDSFEKGGNHPDDIENIIRVFQWLKHTDIIIHAVDVWERGDEKIEQMREVAGRIRAEIDSEELSDRSREGYLNEIITLDEELTLLELEFANTMNTASRRANNLIFWVTVITFLTFLLIVSVITISFIRNLKRSNEQLTASQSKFRNVLDNSRDVIYQHDKQTDRYDYMSSSAKDLLGYSVEDVMEGGPDFMLELIHPDDKKRMQSELKKVRSTEPGLNLRQDTEFRIKKADGTYIWVNNKRQPVRDENGEIVAIVGNVRDISDRKMRMEQIDRSLKDKQIMLAEIHHRVKNNLAIVSGLIEMQKWELKDSDTEQFKELQDRIKSIALVHEKLYNTESFSEISLSQYIKEIVEMISDGYNLKERSIDTRFDLVDLQVDITVAVPIGLISNELINNAFKHAFTNRKNGKLCIRLFEKEENQYELSVTDNGGNLPDDFSMEDNGSLGMTLIRTLTSQLEGEFHVAGGPDETLFSIVFKL